MDLIMKVTQLLMLFRLRQTLFWFRIPLWSEKIVPLTARTYSSQSRKASGLYTTLQTDVKTFSFTLRRLP